jgi:hypothetical protein
MAELLGVSIATAGRMIRFKVVGSIKVFGRRLVPVTEIEKLLESVA